MLALGDEHGAHLVLEEAADALHDLKQHESAATVCRAVADFRARTGDPAGQARALTSLATALAALGRHEAAVGTVTEAVELARGPGNRPSSRPRWPHWAARCTTPDGRRRRSAR